MNESFKQKILLLAGILCILVIFVALYFVLSNHGNQQVNSNVNKTNDQVTIVQLAVSPSGNYLAAVKRNNNSDYQWLELDNLSKGDNHVVDTVASNIDVHSLVWNATSQKLYFAKTFGSPSQYTLFYYVDLSSSDPYSLLDVPYSGEDSLVGKETIVEVADEKLFYQSGSNIYSLDLSQEGGSLPALVMRNTIADMIGVNQIAVSPAGNYVAKLNESGFTIIDLKKTNSHPFPNGSSAKVNYLLWSADGSRLFFLSILHNPQEYTEFGFIDMTERHKYDSTGLVPDVSTDTAKIFEGEVELVGSKGDSIYIVSKGLLYELPIYGIGDTGGAPKLIKDLN